MSGVRVIVCRVLAAPVVETIEPGLEAMQRIVGGYIERVGLAESIDLWCNEEGRLIDLPISVILPGRAPVIPEGWEIIDAPPDAPAPGQWGEYRIHGDCFVARATPGGETTSLTDDDIDRWLTVLGLGAREAMRRQGARPDRARFLAAELGLDWPPTVAAVEALTFDEGDEVERDMARELVELLTRAGRP